MEFKKENKAQYFSTPIYTFKLPQFLKKVSDACEKYIISSKNHNQKLIEQRNKILGKDIKDMGWSYNSNSLINDPDLIEFQSYIGTISYNILIDMGYDLSQQEVYWTEFWAQEFSRLGGGHHEGHIHHNNHISGFYFLKCSDKTSYPVFHDPRYVKYMNQLPMVKNVTLDKTGLDKIQYKIEPGVMIFFPAYLEHEFIVDPGIEPFRFIHFNLQAIRKGIADTIRSLVKVDTTKNNK